MLDRLSQSVPVLTGIGLTLTAWGWAQPSQLPEMPPYEPVRYLWHTLISLFFVCALIVGTYWLLRRLSVGRSTRSTGPAELLQSMPLSGGYYLHLVRIEDKLTGIVCGPGGAALREWPLPKSLANEGETSFGAQEGTERG